jgi:hypothetical protein
MYNSCNTHNLKKSMGKNKFQRSADKSAMNFRQGKKSNSVVITEKAACKAMSQKIYFPNNPI